ncbi:MAG TPA: translation initiation factor IF-3 [Verrucomicrobiae bacterium]
MPNGNFLDVKKYSHATTNEGVLSRPFPPRHSPSASFVRVNGKIRAREVRIIKDDKQLGIFPLNEALNLARQHGVDLVEISPNATPPVCRLVDFGKFRYEQAKREKESRKHQHATTVKEVQLSPRIDPHDLGIKITHAIGFLCEDMKVKIALKFRGREMAHTEIGFEVIKDFLEKLSPYGHPDFEPKLIGKGINAMISPLPRNKRAKSPIKAEENDAPEKPPKEHAPSPAKHKVPVADEHKPGAFANNPFAKLDVK